MKTKESTNNQWIFVVNNYSDNDIITVQAIALSDKNKCKYLIFGKEVGDSGTPHLQGFVQFAGRKKFSTVKALFPKKTHLEPKAPDSTSKQASDYCGKGEQSHSEWKKQGTKGPNYGLNAEVWSHGELENFIPRAGQGARNDLVEARRAVDAGMSAVDLMKSDEHCGPGFKYRGAFKDYEAAVTEPRNFKSYIFVFFGDSGTYKSHAASAFAKAYKVIRPRHKHDGAW